MCVLCAVAAFALKDYLAIPIFVIFAYPVLFIVQFLFNTLFILGEFYLPRKIDQWLMWTIMASICGNIAGITVVAWFSRARDALTTPQSLR